MFHIFRVVLSLTLLWLLTLPALERVRADSPADLSSAVNTRVLEYCKDNLGNMVGNGECAALGVQALRAAGAKPRSKEGFPTNRDYVWGKLVLFLEGTPEGTKVTTGSVEDIQPGDIAQFSNARFVTAHFAHHTAVVADLNKRHLRLFQQNIGGKHVVFEGAVRIDKLSSGWIRFYRPIPITN